MLEIAKFIIVGFSAGIMSGLVGIGGATIVIPLLVLFFGFQQKMAQGTTLAMMIPPIGLLAAITYFKEGHVNIKIALILALGFFFGGLFGSRIAIGLPDHVLKKIFAVFLFFIAVRLFFSK